MEAEKELQATMAKLSPLLPDLADGLDQVGRLLKKAEEIELWSEKEKLTRLKGVA